MDLNTCYTLGTHNFFPLSKFTLIPSTSTPLFSNLDVNYFPSGTYTGSETYECSSSQLLTLSVVPYTYGDDILVVVPALTINELSSRVRNLPT